MNIFIFLLSIFFICQNCYAQSYVAKKKDGGTAFFSYKDGSEDSIMELIDELNFEQIRPISEKDLPVGEEIRFLKYNEDMNGPPVIVDTVLKVSTQAAEDAEETEVNNILGRLKITKEEFQKLKKNI